MFGGRGGGRGGGGGGWGRGGGGGGGGGEQRWWDPVWRGEKLAKIKQSKQDRLESLDLDWLSQQLQQLKHSNETEIVLRSLYPTEDMQKLHQLCAQAGFFSKRYGNMRYPVIAISKVELPSYRAEFDPKQPTQHAVSMKKEDEVVVSDLLRKLKRNKVHHHHPGGKKDDSAAAAAPAGSRPAQNDRFATIARGEEESQRLFAASQTLSSSPEFISMQEKRNNLPAAKMKDHIVSLVSQNQVIVVSGETGCGKTTQIPQFLLETAISSQKGGEINIICTQPRRISAISVAERVAQERGEKIGDAVGYQIRLESARSNGTHLLFCTTGVLLRRLINDPLLQDVTHVIVDEIHERGMNEDFLLIILRDLLPQRPDLRVILMSATLNAQLFQEYFSNCPAVHIPGFTYPVDEFYLEHLIAETNYMLPVPKRKPLPFGGGGGGRGRKREDEGGNPNRLEDESSQNVNLAQLYPQLSPQNLQSLSNFSCEQLDLFLIQRCIEHVARSKPPGAILVFLTGWEEISKLHTSLTSNRSFLGNSSQFRILPLHGSMPTINQREIFDRPPPNVRKIILATNIAETSITIDDVTCVIDAGMAKEKSYDATNDLETLLPVRISRASATQRAGRAGRVQAGVCYHLFPSHELVKMDPFQLPELLRTPLESLCLQIKSLGLGLVSPFLAKALQPPPPRSVENALNLLQIIGALEGDDEQLTPLGSHLATLPVSPRIGKMILMGAIFQCLNPVLTIASSLSFRDCFVMPVDKKDLVDQKRREFAANSFSDHLCVLNVFEKWEKAKREGNERWFVNENFLSTSTLHMIADMSQQFKDLLSDLGFNDPSALNINSSNVTLVKAVICAGMVPNIASVKNGKRRAKLKTLEDGKVDLHPASVNSGIGSFPHRWLVYNEKVKTSGIFIRDSTNVSDYSVMLFGGKITRENNVSFSMNNGFCTFSAPPSVADLIVELREEVDELLQHHIENPGMNWHQEGRELIDAVKLLLESDHRDFPEEKTSKKKEKEGKKKKGNYEEEGTFFYNNDSTYYYNNTGGGGAAAAAGGGGGYNNNSSYYSSSQDYQGSSSAFYGGQFYQQQQQPSYGYQQQQQSFYAGAAADSGFSSQYYPQQQQQSYHQNVNYGGGGGGFYNNNNNNNNRPYSAPTYSSYQSNSYNNNNNYQSSNFTPRGRGGRGEGRGGNTHYRFN